MFPGVHDKLIRTEYFLNRLIAMTAEAGTIASIKRENIQEMKAMLDGFFFEIISAKDFFLQGINDKYVLALPKTQATQIPKLKKNLKDENALKVVGEIENLLRDSASWLWQLNNYRNSATHRELIHFGFVVTIPPMSEPILLSKEMISKIKERKYKVKPIFEGEVSQPNIPKIHLQNDDIRTYLFKNPENPKEGNATIEVIPYLQQSLEVMRNFLATLYAKLA